MDKTRFLHFKTIFALDLCESLLQKDYDVEPVSRRLVEVYPELNARAELSDLVVKKREKQAFCACSQGY